MLDKFEEVVERFNEISKILSDPSIASDQEAYQKYTKEYADIKDVVEKYLYLKKLKEELSESYAIASGDDKELYELAQLDIDRLKDEITQAEQELKTLLLPKDPYDDKNIYLEIRAGTGGDESTLFAADLLRMYIRYAELLNWKTEIIDFNETGVGGYREVVLLIKGKGAYSRLKFEGGGHRVQRIPDTEASGRVHTSMCTVAVLPEADDIDISIEQKDLKIDTYRSGGAGGQHVNTTDSAIRITHIPTNIVVTCQDERSQVKNKEKAMKILKAKLLDLEIGKRNAEISDSRKLQVGSGDRSERIRTYNFPQNRLTEHRINLTSYNLDKVMEGELAEIISSLIAYDQAEKMKTAGLA